jgi:hypothetical protein
LQWIGDHTVYDHSTNAPYPGVHEAFDRFHMAGHKVLIHSCNNPAWIREMCEKHNLRPDWIWGETGMEGSKPVAALYVDDRAMQFVSWDREQVSEMLARVEGRPVRRY